MIAKFQVNFTINVVSNQTLHYWLAAQPRSEGL